MKKSKLRKKFEVHRREFFYTLSALLQLLVLLTYSTPRHSAETENYEVNEVAFVSSVVVREQYNESTPDDGEVVLSERLNTEVQKQERNYDSALDPNTSGATEPVDLSPTLKPTYTEEARSESVTGTLTLELVIDESGTVVSVRSVGRKLGYGLEESATSTFKKKRYSPSFLDGVPVTVRVLVPVRFTLQ